MFIYLSVKLKHANSPLQWLYEYDYSDTWFRYLVRNYFKNKALI